LCSPVFEPDVTLDEEGEHKVRPYGTFSITSKFGQKPWARHSIALS
jgi:hypothetical protein